MNIYAFDSYREIISTIVEERKKIGKSVTYSALADAIRVQRPYVSKVLSGMADFNSDQLFMACKFLDLNEEHTNYLLLLLEYERSFYPERKEILENKIKLIKEEKRDTGTKLKERGIKEMDSTDFDKSDFADYYIDPDLMLIHIHLCLKKFADSPKNLISILGISENRLENALVKLQKIGLIELKHGKVNILLESVHLPRDSKLISPHQMLMRQRSIQRIQNLEVNNKKVFSVTFTSNEKARKKIEDAFNDFINQVRDISQQGKMSECYQLNFDFFPWSINERGS